MESTKRLRTLPRSWLLLVLVIAVGALTPWLIEALGDYAAATLYLVLITVPFLHIVFRILAGRHVDLFAPGVFFALYFWIHLGLGTFLFMLVPASGLTLNPLVPILNIAALYAFFAGLVVARAENHSPGPPRQRIARMIRPFLLWHYKRLQWVMIAGIAFSLVAAAIFFRRAGGIPILFGNVEEGRVQAIWGNAYAAFLALSISYVFLAYWTRHIAIPGSRLFNFRLLILLIVTVAILASFGYRSRLVWFVVSMLIAYNYQRHRLRMRHFVLFGMILLFFVVVVGIWRISTADAGSSASVTMRGFLAFGQNMFKRSTISLIAVTNLFPGQEGFRWGSVYLYPLILLLPGHQDEFATWLKQASGLEFKGGGLPPTLVGEIYLNFGFVGVLIGFLLLGFLVARLYLWLRRYPSMLRVLLYAVIMTHLSQAISGGFSGTVGVHMLWGVATIVAINRFVFHVPWRDGRGKESYA